MAHTENATLVMLEPCDVFLTRGSGLIPQAIRFFTRRFGEARSKVNHVGIIVDEGNMLTAMAVEALVRVRRHPLGRYAKKLDTAVAVYRPINLTDEEQQRIVAKALDYVGREYGVTKIAAHFLDWTLQGAYVFRRFTNVDNYPICSWLVAHAFDEVDKRFGCDPGAASPDDIWDFVTTNPDKYTMVHPLVPIGMYEPATVVRSGTSLGAAA